MRSGQSFRVKFFVIFVLIVTSVDKKLVERFKNDALSPLLINRGFSCGSKEAVAADSAR